MDLELKNIGQTLAIGGFAVFGLFHLINLCKPSWKSKLTSLLTGDQKFPKAAMLLALIFAVGMLVEDISKNFMAERWRVAGILYTPFDTDKQLLLKSLFEVKSSSGPYVLQQKPLYKDLMEVEHDNKYFLKHSADITKIIETGKIIDESKKTVHPDCFKEKPDCFEVDMHSVGDEKGHLRVAVAGMFYAAKNRVYAEENYFNELREIVARINFARSIIFICLLCSACYLLLWLICLLAGMKSRFLPKLNFKFFRNLNSDIQPVRMNMGLIFFFFLAYLLGAVLAGIAYKSESRENNERVFGYYTSIVANKRG